MQQSFYKLPLRLDQIIRKQKQETCNLRHSVAQNLHLIISTYRGESAYSDDYGCSLWDEEFNIQLNSRWKEMLVDSLQRAVGLFEKRLEPEEIRVVLLEQNELSSRGNFRIRKCLNIEIRGVLKKINEPFHFRDSIYISPLAQL